MARRRRAGATNLDELRDMIMAKARSAVEETQVMAMKEMKQGVQDFYDYAEPVKYVRTGALGKTPSVTPIVEVRRGGVYNSELSFTAYLDKSHQYTTGKEPDMEDVLNLTNYKERLGKVGYLRDAVGKSGYWEESLDRIDKDFYKAMIKRFKRGKKI